MSMMANQGGSGQIIAAGQPFKVRLRKKKAPADGDPEAATESSGDRAPDRESDDEQTDDQD